jgi:DNA transformation protein
MSVTDSFKTYVLEQLERVVPDLRSRSMFGGVGIYSGDLFFALIDDDLVYFKTDDTTRRDFEARGMGPFRPTGEDGETMRYHQLPEDVLEDPEALAAWAEKSIGVAARSKQRPKGRGKGRKT